MGSFSDYLEAKLLDLVFSGAAFSPSGTIYLAMFTVTPTDAGGGTEATGGGYARLAVTNNATNFPASTGTAPTTKNNGVALTYPQASGDWSTGSNMVAFAWFDAVGGGNMYMWGALTQAKPVLSGDTPSVAINGFTATLD
jgi:hypothetical protein